MDQASKKNDNIKRGKAFPLAAKPDDRSRKYTSNKYRDSISKPEDLEKFRLVPKDESSLGLWEQAWEQVKDDEDDWKLWPQFQGVKDLKTNEVVAEVHGFAQTRRDEAEKNQGHVFGTSLTYRKMCSNVAKCAKKFQIVGDMVAQAEPVYAALPWVIMPIPEHPFALADTSVNRLLFTSSLRYSRSTKFRKRCWTEQV